jgi:type II secretory pathway component PulF
LLTLNQLAVMSQNGIEIAEALETIACHCTNKRLAASLRKIHKSVNSGQPFSAAVAAYGNYFPCTLAPMLAAAEATGDVPKTLGNVCTRMRGELQMRGTILGAMIYPVILILASSVVMTALVFGVLPQFASVFVSLGRPVPASTQMLLDLGTFCRSHWIVIAITTSSSLVLLYLARHHPLIQRPLNRFLMYGPLICRAYRPLQAGRTLRTLASMVAGGVPLLQAVRLTRHTVSDFYWRSLLDRIETELIDGATASRAMTGVDFIPLEAPQMMATAERTGRVAEVLDNIGEFYEEDAGRRIKRLVVTLEPAIILVMGVMVACVVMSLLLPLLDVTSVR